MTKNYDGDSGDQCWACVHYEGDAGCGQRYSNHFRHLLCNLHPACERFERRYSQQEAVVVAQAEAAMDEMAAPVGGEEE